MDTWLSNSIRESMGGPPRDPSRAALERLAIPVEYASGESIYRCNEPIEHWYRVVAGAARKSAVTGDGRRHVADFFLPGDFFGYSAPCSDRFCVEAILPRTLIRHYPRQVAEKLADSDPQIAHSIRECAFKAIVRLQWRTVTLACASALEKVSAFLLEMADRSHGAQTDTVFLPMSRYDIADYLGMAVETVSRTLTELAERDAIAFRSVREVRISDRIALEAFAAGMTQLRPSSIASGRGASHSIPSRAGTLKNSANRKDPVGARQC